MTYTTTWEEFELAVGHIYSKDPMNVRCTMKYIHTKNMVVLKVTDDRKCIQFRTEIAQDLKKIDTFMKSLMRLLVSKEH